MTHTKIGASDHPPASGSHQRPSIQTADPPYPSAVAHQIHLWVIVDRPGQAARLTFQGLASHRIHGHFNANKWLCLRSFWLQ